MVDWIVKRYKALNGLCINSSLKILLNAYCLSDLFQKRKDDF